jgi:hypothetical protein
MFDTAFDLGEELHNRLVNYYLHNALWAKFTLPTNDLDFAKWQSLKYLNNSGDDFHADVQSIPNDKGGIYLFYIKCPIITGITEYPFYIGRAQYTDHQNLRKRVKEYYLKFSKNGERPKITRMFKYWSTELYLAYLTLPDNNKIIELEKQLINALLLPMNDEIPDQTIKQAVKAF